MTTVDLRTEAAAEVRRLTAARALLHHGDEQVLGQLEGGATWIMTSRRTRLRQSLGSRVCLLWRLVAEDETGRVVESRLVPVVVEVARDVRALLPAPEARRHWIRALLRDPDGAIRARVEAACDAWRTEVSHVTSAFTSARLSRERAIAAQPAAVTRAAQSGLFDRRVQRAHANDAAAAAASGQQAGDRARSITGAGTITFRPARLLLVVAP